MELREALRTTGAVRAFLDRPVDRALLYDVLDTARFAPSGGNRQGWRVVLVEDPARRRALRDAYLPAWYEYLAQSAAGLTAFSPVNDPAAEAEAVAHAPAFAARGAASPGFAEGLDAAPALLALVADLAAVAALDRDLDRYQLVGGASIYPFAWSILLAAHDVGLAGVLTTMACRAEPELRGVLDLGADEVLAGLLVLGWPQHRPRRLRREPVESFATVDRRSGPPLRRD